MTRERVLEIIKQILADELSYKNVSEINSQMGLMEYGYDSIDLVTFVSNLEERLNIVLSPSDFIDVPSIEVLADNIVKVIVKKEGG